MVSRLCRGEKMRGAFWTPRQQFLDTPLTVFHSVT